LAAVSTQLSVAPPSESLTAKLGCGLLPVAGTVTTGTGGLAVSSRYVAVPARLALPAALVPTTESLYARSDAPDRSSTVVGPQVGTGTAGASAVTVQV
jgi:hypothetical protein